MTTIDAIARLAARASLAGLLFAAALGANDPALGAPPQQGASDVARFEVAVPPAGRPFVAEPHTVNVGDRVVFVVTSTRAGHVSIHGLSGDVPVGPGTPARVDVTVRAIGRFPLHFHGDDGAHIALSGLDVYPKD